MHMYIYKYVNIGIYAYTYIHIYIYMYICTYRAGDVVVELGHNMGNLGEYMLSRIMDINFKLDEMVGYPSIMKQSA